MDSLNWARHCMTCSGTYGCKSDDGQEIRECSNCNSDPEYCGSEGKEVTTGVCDDCMARRGE